MDLRQKKTKRSIVNAFLSMRSRMPLEKITVRELAERAEIHKATFYLHYHDVYELSESLEREVIEDILNGISDPTMLLSKPERFNEEMYCQLIAHESLLDILFSGNRAPVLADLMEERLKEYIIGLHPHYRGDLEMNIVLTYLIRGAYHAYFQYRSENQKRVLTMVNRIAGDVLRLYSRPDPEVCTESEKK